MNSTTPLKQNKFALMTFEQCEVELKMQLQTLYDAGEAATIADRLLEMYTNHNRPQRRILFQQMVSEKKLLQIQAATIELLQGRPLQYVLGYADFYGMWFRVNESVLIPRPETEELVDWIIKDYHHKKLPLQVLDVGTGSGCIPISLKKYLPEAVIFSVDNSEEAIEMAMYNADAYQTAIQFLQLDFLQEGMWMQLEKYDVIVSNPPYIPLREKMTMDKNVTEWEPATALFVPDENPLLFYEKITFFAKTHLRKGGTIYLETHRDYAAAVKQLFIQQGYSTELRKDLHGNERMVKAMNRNT